MYAPKQIATDHKDLIHDVSYDFYGRRLATCSSDQCVKVLDLKDGDWHCTATWRCHSGSVWRVTWAHPEFGQVLATCSFDRTVAIWEEQMGQQRGSLQGRSTHWVKRASLVDSRTEVNDVKFSPHHLGLMIATCSTDGMLRIYEAQDVMNLSQWSLMHNLSCKPGSSCLSWNPSRVHPPMIVVGTDDPSAVSSKLHIFEYSEDNRKWQSIHNIVGVVFDPVHDVAFAPNLGRSYHVLAVASSKDINIVQVVPTGTDPHNGHSKLDIRHPAHFDHGGGAQVWRLSWNVTGTVLASSGDDGCVCLWKANYLDNWKCMSVLKPETPHNAFNSHGSGEGVAKASGPTTHSQQPAHWVNELQHL